MDGARQPQYNNKWTPSAMNSEMAAAADSRMDLSRHMQVPDKIYVSESHNSTPSSAGQNVTYRSSAMSTPLSTIPSIGDMTRTASAPPHSDYGEGGMSVPRRIQMGGSETPNQPIRRPNFSDQSTVMVSDTRESAAVSRQPSTPSRSSELQYEQELEDQYRPMGRGMLASQGVVAAPPPMPGSSVLAEVESLKRRVALLERRVASRSTSSGASSSVDENPRGGGLLMVMILSFWLFNPVMFYLWKKAR